VLSFLYEKQRKVEVLAKAEPVKTPVTLSAEEKRA
jgi:nitrate/nitrite transport system ATP-binding protein